MLTNDIFIEKNIRVICGFPGVGKSTLANQYPNSRIIDLDLPGTPMDEYVNQITQATSEGKLVLVPSWLLLRYELADAKIPYAVCYPTNAAAKSEYLLRYKARGSSDELIQRLCSHWDYFIESMAFDARTEFHFQLTLDGQTLQDVISPSLLWHLGAECNE